MFCSTPQSVEPIQEFLSLPLLLLHVVLIGDDIVSAVPSAGASCVNYATEAEELCAGTTIPVDRLSWVLGATNITKAVFFAAWSLHSSSKLQIGKASRIDYRRKRSLRVNALA